MPDNRGKYGAGLLGIGTLTGAGKALGVIGIVIKTAVSIPSWLSRATTGNVVAGMSWRIVLVFVEDQRLGKKLASECANKWAARENCEAYIALGRLETAARRATDTTNSDPAQFFKSLAESEIAELTLKASSTTEPGALQNIKQQIADQYAFLKGLNSN